MKGYETIFITNPDLDDDQRNAALEKVRGAIAKSEGTIYKEFNWGRRRLAYEVQGHDHGVYHVFYLQGPSELISQLNITLRYADEIIKFQTVRSEDLDRDISDFKKLLGGKSVAFKKKESDDEEIVTETELAATEEV